LASVAARVATTASAEACSGIAEEGAEIPTGAAS
jgi:hypothetical protein